MNKVKAIQLNNRFGDFLTPDEKENRVKSGVTTGFIVIIICLLLWFYNINLEVPIPLPEAHEVEVMIEPPAGGGGGGGSPSEATVPVDADPVDETPNATEQTPDEKAPVEEVRSPEKPVEKPVDNTIEQMRKRREDAARKAEQEAANGGGGKGTGQGSGEGSGTGPGKGSGRGGGEGSGVGMGYGHSFGSGRSFRPGNTSTDCHQAGKVVLEVQLLSNGKIMFMDVDPGTTGSDCLVKAAKEILRNSSFNEAEGKPTSTGTITFIFKLN